VDGRGTEQAALAQTKSNLPSVKLEDGRVISFDLNVVSMEEYRGIWKEDADGKLPGNEYAEALIERAASLESGNLLNLGYVDYARVREKFFEVAQNPLIDPNSASESGQA